VSKVNLNDLYFKNTIQKPQKMKVSECCNAEATDKITPDICPECKDHCEWVDYDSDDDLIYNNFCHEGGIKY
jgi:hypothetical protein